MKNKISSRKGPVILGQKAGYLLFFFLTSIKNLITLFDIASVNKTVIEDAMRLKFTDFEDAIVYQSSCLAGMEAIVSRDPSGFKHSKLPVFSPMELLTMLEVIE